MSPQPPDPLAKPALSRTVALNVFVVSERRLAAAAAGAWLGVLVVAGVGLGVGLGPLSASVIAALALMAVPALVSALVLSSGDGPGAAPC